MNKDSHLENETQNYEKAKEQLIQTWIDNGHSSNDAVQLYDDMINDPWHNDPDMDSHQDSTIDERLAIYSRKKK
jgi:hypothetical protein